MVSPSPASASSAPAGSGQFSIHPRHERLLHPREDVGVDAQGDIDAGVPEHLAHDLGVLAPTESESRKAVAEVGKRIGGSSRRRSIGRNMRSLTCCPRKGSPH